MIAFLNLCKRCEHLAKIQIDEKKFGYMWQCCKSDDPRATIVAIETTKGIESKGIAPPVNCPFRLEHIMWGEELKEIMGSEVNGYTNSYAS